MFASRIACATAGLLMICCAGNPDALAPCGADMVLSKHAASPGDALMVRTTDAGAAFAILPHTDLKRCGIRGGKDYGIDRTSALAKCGEMPGCFAIDYYPKKRGGAAFYCVEKELFEFGRMADEEQAADMAHFYKVSGTSCSSLISDSVLSCDADGVLSNHVPSRADVVQSRTTNPTAAFASLVDDFLQGCGGGEQGDAGISRGEAIAKCKARSDCFAIDFYPVQKTAHYCSDPSLVSLQNTKTKTRMRGGGRSRVTTEHIYKVKGATCLCTHGGNTDGLDL